MVHTASYGNVSRRERFGAIVEMSRSMLEKAHSGEWETVVDLQAKRKELIREFFAQVPAPEEAEFLRDGIENILTIDKEVIALGETERNGIGEQLQRAVAKRRASAAYQVNR